MSKTNRSELLDDRFGSSNNKLSNIENSGWATIGDDDSILPENPSPSDMAQMRVQHRKIMQGCVPSFVFHVNCALTERNNLMIFRPGCWTGRTQ